MNNSLENLKSAYREYLSTLSIGCLRSVGRMNGVEQATLKTKADLVERFISVLTGEIPPAKKSKRGAPVKDKYVNPLVFEKLQQIKMTYLASLPAPDSVSGEVPNVIKVRDSSDRTPPYYDREVYCGQLGRINGVPCLLPLSGREGTEERIVVSEAVLRSCDLRQGDIVSCRAERVQAALIASEVLTVNELPLGTERPVFEKCRAEIPEGKVSLFGKGAPVSMKYVDWLVPFGLGQRYLIAGAAKTGKTSFLLDFARAFSANHPEIKLFILLLDRPPEAVSEFTEAAPGAQIVSATYDDDANFQLFMADFMLGRTKRFAESGYDVVLLVDSLDALTRAYREAEETETEALPEKGLNCAASRRIRQFFGSARRLKRAGSLSVVATVSCGSGNGADDFIAGELLSVASAVLFLDGDLAADRVYPAVDVRRSASDHSELLFGKEEMKTDAAARRYLSAKGKETLAKRISSAGTREDFAASLSAGAARSRQSDE